MVCLIIQYSAVIHNFLSIIILLYGTQQVTITNVVIDVQSCNSPFFCLSVRFGPLIRAVLLLRY